MAFVASWLGLVFVGLFFFTRYEWQPGTESGAPVHWPSASHIAHAGGHPTLLLFLHPRCSCSEASIAELGQLVQQAPSKPNLVVVFVHPHGAPADWTHTALWHSAEALPGAQLLDDQDGREADDFLATTSGRTLLYGADGNLLFAGGITPGRGHEGDNPGFTTLSHLLKDAPGSRPASFSSPVFGCPLQTPSTPVPATPPPGHHS